MEAIAIIGCVAAVISAYRGGGAIVDKIKQKRVARQAPPPPRLLEDSLARGPRAVQEAKETGVERFGTKYADKMALDSLKDIVIDLQGSLLKHLLQAQEDDSMTDFTTLVDTSDMGRIRTVTVLNELYMRVAMGTTVRQTSFGDIGSFSGPLVARQDGPIAPDVVSHIVTSSPTSPSNGRTIQQPRSASADMPEQLNEQQTSATTGFFDKFRRKSSSDESTVPTPSRRFSNTRSKHEAASHDDGQDKAPPLFPMTSPQAAIDEDNPRNRTYPNNYNGQRIPTAQLFLSSGNLGVPSPATVFDCEQCIVYSQHEDAVALGTLRGTLQRRIQNARTTEGCDEATQSARPEDRGESLSGLSQRGSLLDFIAHVGNHRGKAVAEMMLQKVNCVNGRTATHEEDFDVNLTPLEVGIHSTFQDGGQSARHSLLSAAATDRVSYTTKDETASVDPWRDAA
ncbi:MAG: hypothetical protein Q9208_005703 [Pyrenodesmia sp. 3 TL-2023]